jgi:NAD(P)-dependent dehydrogenase (short-subunit alcohol dehydrogenase family)
METDTIQAESETIFREILLKDERLYLPAATRKLADRSTKEGDFPASLTPSTRARGEEDMAGVTLFLCGRAGAYINGTIIISDGGRVGIMNGTY